MNKKANKPSTTVLLCLINASHSTGSGRFALMVSSSRLLVSSAKRRLGGIRTVLIVHVFSYDQFNGFQ